LHKSLTNEGRDEIRLIMLVLIEKVFFFDGLVEDGWDLIHQIGDFYFNY
jgi:hypothetical protein